MHHRDRKAKLFIISIFIIVKTIIDIICHTKKHHFYIFYKVKKKLDCVKCVEDCRKPL